MMDIAVFRERSAKCNGLDRRDADVLIAEIERLTVANAELFGETEHFKRLAQRGDCCKAPDYCGGECTCEICDPQGNIEYWKAYAGEAEKDNDALTAENASLIEKLEAAKHNGAYADKKLIESLQADREELFGETERLKTALELYADKTRWSRAWGDDEALLYNIRENGGDGWSIAQEALAKKKK